MTTLSQTQRPTLWLTLTPALFVVLWASGFIGAKFGLIDAPPLTFLAIRFAIAAALLGGWAAIAGSAWPRRPLQFLHLAVVGLLLHGVYLGAAFVAMDLGMEAGTSALITCLQPLIVASLAAPLLGEKVTGRQWLGLLLGLAGVALVVWRKSGLEHGGLPAIGFTVLALLGITAATLYQKRWLSNMPLLSGSALQFAAAAVGVAIGALLFEDPHLTWSWHFAFAMAWLVFVLSIGAVGLLLLLIRRGAASRVSSLFFLVPPTTALMAWPLFGEVLSPLELAGMALAASGVALVNLAPRK